MGLSLKGNKSQTFLIFLTSTFFLIESKEDILLGPPGFGLQGPFFKAIITWRFITKKKKKLPRREISKNGKNYCWQKLPTKITTQCSLIMNDPHKKGPHHLLKLKLWVCIGSAKTTVANEQRRQYEEASAKTTHTVPKVNFCPKIRFP